MWSARSDAVAAPVYSDICCHYNQRGNDILADFIAARLLAAAARDGGGAVEIQRTTSEGRR